MQAELSLIALTDAEKKIPQFILGLLSLLVLDAVWLSVTTRVGLYEAAFNKREVRAWYGLIAWASLAFGISILNYKSNWYRATLWGSCVGLIGYGTFNGTEAAIRSDWRKAKVIAADMCWGTFACCVASVSTNRIMQAVCAC